MFPDDGEEAEILLKNADHAMYAAKRMGRNAFKVYTKDSDPIDRSGCLEKTAPEPLKKFNFLHKPARMGFALAAALALVAVASFWLTSITTRDSLKIAIEQNMETLTDFNTASGSDN